MTAEERIFVLRNGLRRGSRRRVVEGESVVSPEEAASEGAQRAEGAKEPSKAVVGDSYRRQRTELLLDLRAELVPWMRKRFWIATGIGVVAALLLIHVTVRAMLSREFRVAARKAAESEQSLKTLQAQVDFYKQLVTELDLHMRKAEDALRQMEARITAATGAIPFATTSVPSAGSGQDLARGASNGASPSLLEQSARKELMQENAAYKVIVFTAGSVNDLLAQKVMERLEAENFRVASVLLPASVQPRNSVDMECTVEAAQKAREVRDFVARLATALGQAHREVKLRYTIAEGVTPTPPEKREIRIFF